MPPLIFERPVVLTEEQIADTLIQLGARRTRRQGENIQSDHCMLHGNNSPTLGVSVEFPYRFNCFSCGEKGKDIVTLVSKAKKIDRASAVSWFYERYALSGKKAAFQFLSDEGEQRERFVIPRTAMAAYPLSASNDRGYRAAEWYLGASRADADRFRLGYYLAQDRLLFPVFHADGALGGLVGRSMRDDCKKADRWRNLDAGKFKKEFVLMGAELPVDNAKPIIVVEGPKDFFKIRLKGWDNVRAILGVQPSEWQLETLVSYGRPIVLLLDEDEAGSKSRKKLILKTLRGRIPLYAFKYPEGYADEHGKTDPGSLDSAGFAALVTSFKPVFDFGASFSK